MIASGRAHAKVNISLDIVSKMDDGYHDMLTVMQSVSLHDEIAVECVPGKGVGIDSDLKYIPGDERNIAVKAALAFFEHTGIEGFRTRIAIKKTIPVCAGLGGGSADGACVLLMLDRMFETGLGAADLRKLGGSIGSDVPFCMKGGTMLARGRGDDLSELPGLPRCYLVICKPPFSFSTPELFKLIRCERIRARPDTEGIVEALGKGDLCSVARRMYNVFEDVLPRGERDIADIKNALLDGGALGAVMTGSGSAVFGLFDDRIKAGKAYEELGAGYADCFLCETI